MSEKTDKLAGEVSEKASQLATLRGLTEHPAWAIYMRMLQEQVQNRQGEILMKPLRSTEEVYAQEYQKGEIQGLTLAQISIFAVIEGLKTEVQVAEAKLERENELEAASPADGGSRVDSNDWHGGSEQPGHG